MPETKHKTIEEIAHQFSPGSEIDVEEAIGELPLEPQNDSSPSHSGQNSRKGSHHSIDVDVESRHSNGSCRTSSSRSDRESRSSECIELLEKNTSNGHVVT